MKLTDGLFGVLSLNTIDAVFLSYLFLISAVSYKNQNSDMYVQRRFRSDCANAHSGLNLSWLHDALYATLAIPTKGDKFLPALGRCTGFSNFCWFKMS